MKKDWLNRKDAIMAETKLVINGQEIKNYKEISGLSLDEELIAYDLPNHILLEEKSFEKWIGGIDTEDAEVLGKILRIDTDLLAGKRVRIYIQSLGPIPKEGR